MAITVVADIDRARGVSWPFNRDKGWAGHPIGELIDAGLIRERDLRWAMSIARKDDLRQACQVLLGIEEDLPPFLPVQPVAPSVAPVVLPVRQPRFAGRISLAEEMCDPEAEQNDATPPPPSLVQPLAVSLPSVAPISVAPPVVPPAPRPVTVAVPKVTSPLIPDTCPVCGSATQRDARWDSRKHGAAWRCAGGLAHYFETVRLPVIRAFFAPDFPVIPATDDQPAICWRDMRGMAGGEFGYLPSANQPSVVAPGTLLAFAPDSGPRHWATCNATIE